MPADIDRAQERDLQYPVDCEMKRRYLADRGNPEATGVCLYCGTRLLTARRWCDVDCRDAWDHEQQLNRMRGVA